MLRPRSKQNLHPTFPVLWPAEYRAYALSLGAGNPLLLMGDPDPLELLPDLDALPDPVGETRFQPVPFVVRKHRNRAVILATSNCFSYCRFCFRREVPPGPEREPKKDDWERIYAWLAAEPDVEEVILSGGDPMTLPDATLRSIAEEVAGISHVKRWRIHSRAPITFPQRFTPSLIRVLSSATPLRVVIHANHPAEIRPSSASVIRLFRDRGIQVFNQSVLLAGINDDPDVLAELHERLCDLGVLPHYLHHLDRAQGTARFRLTIGKGMKIHRALSQTLGDATPRYVVDLPCGAGKCPVQSLTSLAVETGPRGTRTQYRWQRPADWDSLAPSTSCEWWDVWDEGARRCRSHEGVAPALTTG